MYTYPTMSDLHETRVAFPNSQSPEHLQPRNVTGFVELANRLGYKEDSEAEEIHRLCIETHYRDEHHYGEGILGYIRRSESIFYSSEVQNSCDRLEVRQGIWLSIADIHYATGHFSSCLQQLLEVHDDILHSNDLTHLGSVSWLIQHTGAMMTGKEAIMRASHLIDLQDTVDLTSNHFDFAS